MNIVNVPFKNNPYKIIIGSNILPSIGLHLRKIPIGHDAFIVTTPPIRKLYGRELEGSLKKYNYNVKFFEVPDGEKSKSLATALKLMENIAKYDVLKNPFIVALGGGVVGDLAGYVAAVYKRGIPYVQVPTTFLAQIDSAIGGKVAVDLVVGKNLIGAIYQPKLVFSDVKLLCTLSHRQLRNGLAEAVKYGIIDDRKLFHYLENNFEKVLQHNLNVLTKLVYYCSQIKTKVVLADEKETKGIRTILNFGHTVGHAIEAAGGYGIYQHGEAIALGMRIAANLSVKLNLLTKNESALVNNILNDIGLPKKIDLKIKTNQILKLMKHDKKFLNGKNRFVLAKSIGKVCVKEGLPESLIIEVVESFRK